LTSSATWLIASLFAGARSDPFFFDLMGFCNNLKFTGTDYFLDKDVFGIVLEVPNSSLGGSSKVGLWSNTKQSVLSPATNTC
jgi:hypothetical protein